MYISLGEISLTGESQPVLLSIFVKGTEILCKCYLSNRLWRLAAMAVPTGVHCARFHKK